MRSYDAFLLALLILLPVSAVASAVGFARIWTLDSRPRRLAAKLTLAGISGLAFILAAESYYHFVDVRPDGFEFTLSAQRWSDLYWRPINSLGYRDVEYREADFASRRSCIVVGDSFAAGSGIADFRNRFAAVLGDLLGEQWIVPVVALPGWDSTDELEALRAYPHRPDLVVLQYFPNDIEGAARKAGRDPLPGIQGPGPWTGLLTRRSLFADRVYWQWFRTRLDRRRGTYWERLESSYADARIWADHRQTLLEFVEHARREQLELAVLIIPHLLEVERSLPITGQVARVFVDEGVPVLDLAPRLVGREPGGMVVNAVNVHTNEAIGREIAEWLHAMLEDHGKLPG